MKKLAMVGVVALMGVSAAAYAEDAKPAAAATAADAKKEEPKKEEPKKDEATKDAAAPAASGEWKVEGKTCKTLSNRECSDAGDSFASTDGTVYAWTKVTGPKEGGEIHHVWFKGDEQMSDITLKIGGSPWRTYSKKTLGDKSAGDWRVEVRDSNGAVLETLKFTVK